MSGQAAREVLVPADPAAVGGDGLVDVLDRMADFVERVDLKLFKSERAVASGSWLTTVVQRRIAAAQDNAEDPQP